MPERPDLREIAGDIREALEEMDRETLVDVLTYVFKEYVLEGPPPLRAEDVDQLPELEGLSFPELIAALQTRLDLPELGLFQVRGAEVLVRAGGELTPLRAGESRPDPVAAPTASGPPPVPGLAAGAPEREAPAERFTVDEAVARGRGDLAGGERGEIQPPPTRPGGSPAPEAGARIDEPPAAEPKADPPPGEEAPGDDDDASIRFSLLELD